MPSPKRFLSFVMLTVMAWKGTSAAPVEKQSQLEVRQPGGNTLAYTRHRRGDSGLAGITNPTVEGVANPLLGGLGRGVAGAAAGTQQVVDLLGDAAAELAHVIGGVAANAEQGTGATLANAGPAMQSTVSLVDKNGGAVGTLAKLVGGR